MRAILQMENLMDMANTLSLTEIYTKDAGLRTNHMELVNRLRLMVRFTMENTSKVRCQVMVSILGQTSQCIKVIGKKINSVVLESTNGATVGDMLGNGTTIK
jgi:hypothetical protein